MVRLMNVGLSFAHHPIRAGVIWPILSPCHCSTASYTHLPCRPPTLPPRTRPRLHGHHPGHTSRHSFPKGQWVLGVEVNIGPRAFNRASHGGLPNARRVCLSMRSMLCNRLFVFLQYIFAPGPFCQIHAGRGGVYSPRGPAISEPPSPLRAKHAFRSTIPVPPRRAAPCAVRCGPAARHMPQAMDHVKSNPPCQNRIV